MYEELLAQVPLFHDMSRRELTWLSEACREREYVPGQTILSQGGGTVGLVLVLEGSICIARQQGDGLRLQLDQVSAGGIIGEQALLGNASGTETVTATEPTRVLFLPIWDFRMILRDYPDIAIHLLSILGQQARPNDTTH